MSVKRSFLSWSDIKERYPEDKFIHVLPAEDSLFAHGEPQWRLDVTPIKFDPTSSKDCYPIEKAKGGYDQSNQWVDGEVLSVGLTKGALERLAAAADVSIIGERVDNRCDDNFAEFVAVGVMSSKSGTIRTQPASKTWNGRLRREVKQREAEKKWDLYGRKDWGVTIPGQPKKQARACTEEEKQIVIANWFADEWLREREFGPPTAESKCQNRARRAILGLSAKYTFAEIQAKTFIVPRWAFEPDMSDPVIKQMVVGAGLQAQSRAFLLPPSSMIPEAAALPPGATQALPAASELLTLPAPSAEIVAAEDAAEAAEDAGSLVDTTQGPTDTRTGEVFPQAEQELTDEPRDQASASEEDPDDVDAIADGELTFYLAAAIRSYQGPEPEKIKSAWEKASHDQDFRKLRIILRGVYNNAKQGK